MSRLTEVNLDENAFLQALLPSSGLEFVSHHLKFLLFPLSLLQQWVHTGLVHFFSEEVVDSAFKPGSESSYKKSRSEEAPDIEHGKDWLKRNNEKLTRDIIFNFCSFGVKRFYCFQDKFASRFLYVIA